MICDRGEGQGGNTSAFLRSKPRTYPEALAWTDSLGYCGVVTQYGQRRLAALLIVY